nr:carbohydrate kinase [Bacteroidia bacterium]
MEKKYTLSAVCFGEVLWDIFPTHKKIGGAPLNVSLRMNSIGVNTTMISRIGDDDNGKDILSFLNDQEVATDLIQITSEYKTGAVQVMINEKGNASYDILYPSAWDKIIETEMMDKVVAEADAFVFGSLACRDEVTRATLNKLLEKANYKIFDVNLRAP